MRRLGPLMMRIGLIGSGYWARTTHAPALAEDESVCFAGVWSPNSQHASLISDAHEVRLYPDFESALGDVDALVIAVPPNVQPKIAVRAAEAGKHLLLEKPLATTSREGRMIEAAVSASRVASIVFFTCQFSDPQSRWLERAESVTAGWSGGWAHWLSSAMSAAATSPYAGSKWREKFGALWDLGPHALSTLSPTLGRVVAVTGSVAQDGTVHLILSHASGALSNVILSIFASPTASGLDVSLWGTQGTSSMPTDFESSVSGVRAAIRELQEAALMDEPKHRCDVHFGQYVVNVLEAADRSIRSGRKMKVLV